MHVGFRAFSALFESGGETGLGDNYMFRCVQSAGAMVGSVWAVVRDGCCPRLVSPRSPGIGMNPSNYTIAS